MVLTIALSAATATSQEQAKPLAKPSAAEQKEIKRLSSQFTKATDEAGREQAFAAMLAVHPSAAAMVRPAIEQDLGKQVAGYTKALEVAARPAYVEQLEKLSQEQIDQIQFMRRMWFPYVRGMGGRTNFQEAFLQPCLTAKEAILPKADAISDAAVAGPRQRMVEFANYLSRCDAALGIGPPDPTQGKVSKTGIPYPPLDEPPTFLDNLSYLERTIILAHTVAPPGARRVLMRNAEFAREIDVQEAEFVMFANEVRMIVGQIAWEVDPLICCCTRDHSNDRKDGKASGHMSDVPGKRGFTHRMKLWGCRGGSEGAGGGNDGVNYIEQLSYGGGHTGPLYSMNRNVVGVGRRGNVYTSIYATDKALQHPTQASQRLLFLPPGLDKADVRGTTAIGVASLLAAGNVAGAAAQLSKVDFEKQQPYERMLLGFFQGWVTAEKEYFLKGLAEVEQTGDLFDLKRRVVAGSEKFGSMDGVAEKIAPFVEKLKAPEAARLIEAGQMYRALAKLDGKTPGRLQQFTAFAQHYTGTPFAEAATTVVQSNGEQDPWVHFRDRFPVAVNYGWPFETW